MQLLMHIIVKCVTDICVTYQKWFMDLLGYITGQTELIYVYTFRQNWNLSAVAYKYIMTVYLLPLINL